MNPTVTTTRRTVTFNTRVRVQRTFATEDYDRSAVIPAPMQREDIQDFFAYRNDMQASARIEQQLRLWKQREIEQGSGNKRATSPKPARIITSSPSPIEAPLLPSFLLSPTPVSAY